VVRLLGILAIATAQVPVKVSIMGKGFYAQSRNFGKVKHEINYENQSLKKEDSKSSW